MRKTLKKSLAVLAAASVCSSMLLNFPSGTFQIRWSASAEEPAGTIEGIAIDETNFPDANFRTYVQENFDTTADGILSESERKQATKIQVSNKNISDLTGISYFTELTDLNCDSDNLTALDLSKNTELITLVCPSNNLTALDLSKNTKLTDLYCNSNDLTVLNVRNNTELTILACSSNDLTELDVSQNTKLTSLYCKSNDLTALDVRNNTELTILECFSNDLTELDVSQNAKLTFLYCDSNNLTTLDISQNTGLTHLSCSDNMYVIVVTDHSFDLGTLPGNFDVSKASDWTNATIDGNTLTVTDLKADVTYTYNLGNEKTATFTLHPVSCILTESMAEAIPIQSYTGSAITPDVTLQYDDTILQKDTDYTVSYTNNTEIGTAKAIITGIGSFAGKIEIPFEIGVAINETNFPDEVFRRDLKWKFPEMQGDILSQSELEKVTEMGCRVGTLDLTGIAFFKNLK